MENILINFAGILPSQQMMNRSINLFKQFSWSLVFDHRDSEDVGVNSVVVIIVVVRILFSNTPPAHSRGQTHNQTLVIRRCED